MGRVKYSKRVVKTTAFGELVECERFEECTGCKFESNSAGSKECHDCLKNVEFGLHYKL